MTKRLRLLALVWALLGLGVVAPIAHAVNGDCTIESIGTGAGAGAGVALSLGTPATITPGSAILIYAGTNSATGASTTNPTGYDLLKQGSATGEEVWCKIAGLSETVPSMTWDNRAAGFAISVSNAEGWPACTSMLGDSATGSTATTTVMRYGALTVTQGGQCAFQFGKNALPTGNTNTVTSVNLTGGYTAAGFAASNAVNGVVVAAQMFTTDATTPDLAQVDVTRNTNTDSATVRYTSLTLLSGDKVAADLTAFTDQTNAALSTIYTHSALTASGFDNWTDISITGSGCEYNPGSRGWTSSAGYINIAESYQVRGTSSGSPATAVNCALTIGTKSDTYTITTAAAGDDSLSDPYAWTDVTGQELSTNIESAELQFTSFDAGTITVSGDTGCQWDSRTAAGSYDGFSAGSGTITAGDYVKLRVTSSASDATATNCTSTIGTGANQSDQFRVTTGDSDPGSIANVFTDVTNQALGAVVTSNCPTIANINIATPVTCTALCNINGGSYSTSPGNITVGQSYCARLTTSGSPNTAVTNVVTIGSAGRQDTFSATTAAGGTDEQVQRLVNDTFTGSNGTAIASHSPDVNIPGNPWVAVSGSGAIQSNKLALASGSLALINVGAQDVMIDEYVTFTGSDIHQLETRATDHTLYYRCRFNQLVGNYLLQEANGGVTTLNSALFTFTSGVEYRLLMFSVGTQHGCAVALAAAPTAFLSQVAFSDSSLTDTKVGVGSGTNAVSVDSFSVHRAYKVNHDDTGTVADDPSGLFQGDTVGAGSVFWLSPTNLMAQHTPHLYQGGSLYVNAHASFVGNDDFLWERYDSTANAIDTGLVTVTTTESSVGAAPDITTIPTLTCSANSDPGPVALASFEVVGQPAPTWQIDSGSLAQGRSMNGAGVITGPCTQAGSFSAVVRATNATGFDTATVNYTVEEIETGTLPTCTDIPNLYGFIGDVVSLDLNDYCDDVESYTSSTLASGLSRNGSVVSGTLTTAQHIVTQFGASNQSGTAQTRWMQDVRSSGSDCRNLNPAKSRRIFGHNECIVR